MKEQMIPLLLSIVTTLLNYIFITTITSKQKTTTISDLRDLIKVIREDLMAEIKETKTDLIAQIKEIENGLKKSEG